MPRDRKRGRKNTQGFSTERLKKLKSKIEAKKSSSQMVKAFRGPLIAAEMQSDELFKRMIDPTLMQKDAPEDASQIMTLALLLSARKLMWASRENNMGPDVSDERLSELFAFFGQVVDALCTEAEGKEGKEAK